MKLNVILVVCLLGLMGCLSSRATRFGEFGGHFGNGLKTQRPAVLQKGEYMKSILFGGWVETHYLRDEPNNPTYEAIPIGTAVKISKIERRNLIDHGTEVLAFGVLTWPDGKRTIKFIYELTDGLGDQIRRAPWEDDSVPVLRDR
jgi:hypothetical protein